MNIGFYDPISQRWIKPRPEKEPDPVPSISLGEALLNATEAAALRERNDKIWEYLKQSAEGCNDIPVSPIVTTEPPEYVEPHEPVTVMQGRLIFTQTGPAVVNWSGAFATEPEYEVVESLGYTYWKPKEQIT